MNLPKYEGGILRKKTIAYLAEILEKELTHQDIETIASYKLELPIEYCEKINKKLRQMFFELFTIFYHDSSHYKPDETKEISNLLFNTAKKVYSDCDPSIYPQLCTALAQFYKRLGKNPMLLLNSSWKKKARSA